MSQLSVFKIKNLDTVVIKQQEGRDFFITSPDAIIISIPSFIFILQFLVNNDIISTKVLDGVLEEYNSSGSVIKDAE